MATKKSGGKKVTTKNRSAGGAQSMLKRHQFHTSMAEKHRAHADLIEAQMRVKGQRISRQYGKDGQPAGAKVVPVN